MTRYDENPEAAEAAIKEASVAIDKLDDELAIAKERAEEIERQANEAKSPEEEAVALRRLATIEQEIQDLSQDLTSAERYFGNVQEFWLES
ncbi:MULTISPECIES: hypothetical protein [Paenarthrobacter]|uniref:hypothetical protein n=1 Tax=Paenarthrobacter TaxID=1742992 RepID=UPI001FB5435D|nr:MULTISPECIES: hypothetical protein [Paenarthrobacter]MCW3767778.1 hypothetical protein [Paenarthrobacter sp. PAE-2]UOD83413.1 hypothetical protein MQZ73_19980 [Paenarthrobacter ureafaciens]WNZ05100.1 hypothetical protein PVT25_06080 [Paenarthrobacter ureafaciens]WOC63286.1 hypothetical protein RI444_22340 [Paenarthrobacter sp. AT5]